MMRVLVTGAAGFIGSHLSIALLERGDEVFGVDDLNDYYDPSLKKARLARLEHFGRFAFEKCALEDRESLSECFARFEPDAVVNLAAQAGVRYSITNPEAYIQSNVVGFLNVLESCRHYGVKHLLYASSSSVYGANRQMPFAVEHPVDHPISLYAATKKSNELMAHVYSSLFDVPTTGLRFFTVYGPWGRPDMALFLFTKAILAGQPIRVFNGGDMRRDFTYVGDIVKAVVALLDLPPAPQSSLRDAEKLSPGESFAPFRVCNIGRNKPEELMEMIGILETHLGRKAEMMLEPMQPGDVQATYADVSGLESLIGYKPMTSLEEGIGAFVSWYREYYGVQ